LFSSAQDPLNNAAEKTIVYAKGVLNMLCEGRSRGRVDVHQAKDWVSKESAKLRDDLHERRNQVEGLFQSTN
jgi:hypothetical protein